MAEEFGQYKTSERVIGEEEEVRDVVPILEICKPGPETTPPTVSVPLYGRAVVRALGSLVIWVLDPVSRSQAEEEDWGDVAAAAMAERR